MNENNAENVGIPGTVVSSKFAEKIAARKAELAAAKEKLSPAFMQEDAPTSDESFILSDAEQEIDDAIARIGIVEAYNKWIGKMRPKSEGRTEGIMISCPLPGHEDSDPSAWANSEKNLWHCGGCEQGGDIWDLAAIHYGYPVPGYKDKKLFRELREKIAEELGYVKVRTALGPELMKAKPDDVEQDEQPDAKVSALPAAAIKEISEEDHEEYKNRFSTGIAWKEIIPPGTFLWDWMQATTVDACPEEYHFWTGMLAVGFSAGRRRTLEDDPDVLGNLFVCLTGPSGTGKSRAARHLETALDQVARWIEDDPTALGVKPVKGAGSGESIIDAFVYTVSDDYGAYTPKPISGLIEYGEFATLVAASSRLGSTIGGVLLDMYDAKLVVTTTSRGHGVKRAFKPFASALTTTQNLSLSKLVTSKDNDSGFINRWVFAGGIAKPRLALPGEKVKLDSAVDSLRDLFGVGYTDHAISWDRSSPAAQLWTDFFRDKVDLFQSAKEKESAILQRLDLLYKKLILLFTLNLKETTVPVQAVESAIGLWSYLIHSYGSVDIELSKTELGEKENKVLYQIERIKEKTGRGPTASDLVTALRGSKMTRQEINNILRTLSDMGSIFGVAVTAGKRNVVRYEAA